MSTKKVKKPAAKKVSPKKAKTPKKVVKAKAAKKSPKKTAKK